MSNPFRITPSLGPDLRFVVKADKAWYDGAGKSAGGAGQAMSPQTGDTVVAENGRTYMWVQASATITVAASPGTQIAITDNGVSANPRFTAAAGAGGWYAPHTGYYTGTIVAGDRFWAAKGTAP